MRSPTVCQHCGADLDRLRVIELIGLALKAHDFPLLTAASEAEQFLESNSWVVFCRSCGCILPANRPLTQHTH